MTSSKNKFEKAASCREVFRLCARGVADFVGSPWSFLAAVLLIVSWGITGPIFHFSDTWQLVINTATTIITFLVVFLIQNTQNRDSTAIHLKLDELLRGVKGARTGLVGLETASESELEHLQKEFERIRGKNRAPKPVPEEETSNRTNKMPAPRPNNSAVH